MIFETHAHYDDEAFDKDRDSLLPSLAKHGIEKIINVGASLRGVADTVRLTEKYPFVYGAVGVHPDEIGTLDEEKMKWLKSLCDLPKVVAVGEIGLDYYWDKEHHDIQKKWFVRQMDLAKETELPIIVHSRDAAKDTLDIMKAERADNLKGVIHCYSYSVEQAKEYMNMGYYLGVGGVVTFKNGKAAERRGGICAAGISAVGDRCPVSGAGAVQKAQKLFGLSDLCGGRDSQDKRRFL